MGLNCYLNTGVRDLEVAFFKANFTWRNDIGSTIANLLNSSYAEIKTLRIIYFS